MMLGYFYKSEKTNFWIPVLKSAGIWAVLSGIYYILIKSFNLGKYFM